MDARARARLSLDGLSVGDAFGERFFGPSNEVLPQARLSAEVTHAHAEGIAGAIAVAAAAALAWRRRDASGALGRDWIAAVRDAVPRGYTRDAVAEALDVPSDATIVEAAQTLGNSSAVTAPDTVPLRLWVVAHASRGFEKALWHTVSALGDRDTTCAIVGGVLALMTGPDGIPQRRLQSREALLMGPSASGLTNS